MGCVVTTLGAGGKQTAGSVIGGGLMQAAPFTGPAAPFVAGAGALVGFLSNLFGKRGYDPKKLNDSALTEGVQISFNKMWEDLTGEQIPYACEPGMCGKQGQAIFQGSRWPDVPHPAGRPGVDAAGYMAWFREVVAQASANLVRPESASGMQGNATRGMALLQNVINRQAAESPVGAIVGTVTGLIPRTEAGGIDIPAILPWAIGAAVLYKFV